MVKLQVMSSRKIIHVDCDCFYAAIEMRDDPRLANLPLAVGGNYPTALGAASHGQRLIGQARVITHLNGGIKTVAIHVNDFS